MPLLAERTQQGIDTQRRIFSGSFAAEVYPKPPKLGLLSVPCRSPDGHPLAHPLKPDCGGGGSNGQAGGAALPSSPATSAAARPSSTAQGGLRHLPRHRLPRRQGRPRPDPHRPRSAPSATSRSDRLPQRQFRAELRAGLGRHHRRPGPQRHLRKDAPDEVVLRPAPTRRCASPGPTSRRSPRHRLGDAGGPRPAALPAGARRPAGVPQGVQVRGIHVPHGGTNS